MEDDKVCLNVVRSNKLVAVCKMVSTQIYVDTM